MGNNPVQDITEGLKRIHEMFPEDHVPEAKTPKNPIEAMRAAGIDMNSLREAVGGHFSNIIHSEQVDQTSWRLRVRRITRSGNYTETITVGTNSEVLSENAKTPASNGNPVYRLTTEEAAEQVAKTLGSHLVKIEAVRGDDNLLALHIRENHDAPALHRIFSDLNVSLGHGGWHATMREEKRWTMSPMAGSFLEKRSMFRSAAQPEDTVNESDSRKRAFKAGYPVVAQHVLAQSTDAIMYPAIGDNAKLKDGVETKESKPKKSEKESPLLSKAVSPSGDFL